MAAKVALQTEGLGHGFLPRACVRSALARGELVELALEETRPEEGFWLAWKTGTGAGEALKWWRARLQRPLLPDILPAA
jgi:DNA-binding transcriptional LysR family regulator